MTNYYNLSLLVHNNWDHFTVFTHLVDVLNCFQIIKYYSKSESNSYGTTVPFIDSHMVWIITDIYCDINFWVHYGIYLQLAADSGMERATHDHFTVTCNF